MPSPGQALGCSTGAWSGNPSSFSYTWLRDGAPIAGQTTSSYTVQGADRGHALSCSVTGRNEGGEYLLQGLPSGAYEIGFRAEASSDYLSQEFKERPYSETGDPVVATAGTTTGGVNGSLHRGGQISGKVTAAATGVPLTGVQACAFGTATKSTTCENSGASGEYVLSGLPADSYTLKFQAFEPSQNYAPQYYSGTTKATEATPVQVAAGTTAGGVNIALTAGGSITGTVTGGGAPLAGAEVCAAASVTACAIADSQGRYTITNLATEKYLVSFNPIPEAEGMPALFGSESTELKPPKQSEFVPQYYNGKPSQSEAVELAVVAGAGPTGPINAALEYGGSIAGTVTAREGGSPLANVIVCAEEEGSFIGGRCTITDKAGEYKLDGVIPGSYVVSFLPFDSFLFGSSSYMPQRYKQKEYSEAGDPVTVKQNVGTGNISAELLPGGHVSGRVTAASSGAGINGVEVCAVASKGSLLLGCTLTAASGEYTIAGLAKGMYAVFFVAPENSEYASQVYDNQESEATAKRLEVTPSTSYTGINAALHIGARITGRITGADTGAPIAGVQVCAHRKAEEFGSSACERTQSAGPAGTATSGALVVPAAATTLTVARGVLINARTGAVTFTLAASGPGTLSWSLVFRNADVGFADSLGPPVTAGVARGCKAGLIRHHGRCVHSTVAFAKGTRTVPAGTVKVTVHPTAKALSALRSGHTLHVSGSFVFTSSPGPRVTRTVSAVVRLPRRHGKR